MERMNNHGPNFQDDMTKKWSWGFDEKVLKNDFRFLRRRDWSILGKKLVLTGKVIFGAVGAANLSLFDFCHAFQDSFAEIIGFDWKSNFRVNFG